MLAERAEWVIILGLLALAILPQTSSSFAATITWDGGGDGTDWFDPDNWDSDTVPLDSDDIVIDGNANVDLSDQVLINSGSLVVMQGSSLYMTEESPAVLLGVGGLLVNNGTIAVSNELEITGTLINNGQITVQFEFDNANPQVFVFDEQGVLVNYGNILVLEDAALENYNLLTNFGNITIASNGRYENGYTTTNEATFILREDSSANNGLNFTNNGTILVQGQFSEEGDEGILVNNSLIEIDPTGFFGMDSESSFENNGSFENSGSIFVAAISNSGLILNSGDMKAIGLIANEGNFTNQGTIELTDQINVNSNAFFRNSGQILLGEDFGGEGSAEGTIDNDGTFENYDEVVIIIGSLSNTKTLSNNGTITNQDGLDNSGNGRIRNDGTITNESTINNSGNGRITNAGTINNNDTIDNQNIIYNCGTINGNSPPGTVNGFCPAKIVVVKDTVPDASADFSFTSTTLNPAAFSLDDDAQGPLQNTLEFEDLTPGIYNVTETVSTNYITTPLCDDGSTTKSISAQSDETITCTFTNLLDSDTDGIYSQIDTDPVLLTDDFNDFPLGNGGNTNGTITERESLTVWVTDEPNPAGVKVRALGGPSQNATVSVCNGASNLSLNDGDDVNVTCGSVDLVAISGKPSVLFNSQNGIRSSVVLPGGNGIFFDPAAFRFSVPANNVVSLPMQIEAATKIIVEFPKSEQNSVSFEPESVTFTSGSENQGEIAVKIGDKEEKIQPDSSISPLIVPDQSITINKDDQLGMTLSYLGGQPEIQATFVIVTPPLGQLVQDEQDPAVFNYIPPAGFIGTDRFEFRAIQDSEQSNLGMVTIEVIEVIERVEQRISGAYLGKFDEMSFNSVGNFKVGKGNFKKVTIQGTFDLTEKDAKCHTVVGSGVMDFRKGNTLNVEFNAETCKGKVIGKLDGTLRFAGGTGIFDDAEGTGKFSQINLKNGLIGKLSGNVSVKKS